MSTDVQGRRRTRNPYLGPQSFDRGDVLYGRDVETEELLDLVIAERIVLLYSPSGAGKTSLIQAGLAPRLEAEGLEVLPIIRVTRELPPGSALAGPPRNRYVLSTLLSLEKGLPKELQRDVGELDRMSLAEYLAQRPDVDGRPGNEVLVFDQFEEVVTADPVDQDVKRAFFAEVGAALRDRGVWALFAAREDFLAELDSYARPIPTRLARRYRLSLLTVGQALQAAIGPAADGGVEFRRPAAQQLVDDLARIRVQRPDGVTEVPGRTVEPVQLQVTCRQLWDELPRDATVIDVADVAALGDVDAALATYYAAAVARVAAASGVSERAVRDWFEHALVTPQGIRGQVLQGPEHGPAGAEAVRRLTDAHLVRAESHRGATWYELAHDRLIEPLQADNDRWRDEHLSTLERQAAQWEEQSRPDRLLLVGPELQLAEATSGASAQGVEREFLDTSRAAARRAERERRANRLVRVLLVLAVIGCLIAAGAAIWAYREATHADELALTLEVSNTVNAAGRVVTEDVDLSLLLGQEAAEQLAEEGRGLDDETRRVLQRAVNETPVVQVLRGHGPATAGVYSVDGQRLATAHGDAVVVWDARTGNELHELSGLPDDLELHGGSLAIDATGSRVAAVTIGPAVAVWTVGAGATQEPELWVPHSQSEAYDVAFSPDGSRLASIGINGLSVLDGSGTLVPGFAEDPSAALDAYDVEWTPDGRSVITVDGDGVVALWDAQSGGLVRELARNPSATVLDVDPSGRLLASAGTEALMITDIATGAEVQRVDIQNVLDVSWTTDAAALLAVDQFGDVAVVDPSVVDRVHWVAGLGLSPVTADVDPTDGSRALVTGELGDPALWSVSAGHRDVITAVVSAGDGIAYTGSLDGGVLAWSPDGRVRTVVPTSADAVQDVAVDGAGRRLAVARNSGAVEVWPTEGGAPMMTDVLSDTGAWAVALSPDGSAVAAAGSDGLVATWDVASGDVAHFEQHTSDVVSLDYGTDRTQLVSGALDGTAVVWDVERGGPEQTLRLGVSSDDERIDPVAVEWSPDGALVAVAGNDGSVQFWDFTPAPSLDTSANSLDAGRARERPVRAVAPTVQDIAFDTTGARLFAASGEGAVIVWDVAKGAQEASITRDSAVYLLDLSSAQQLVVGEDASRPSVIHLDDDSLVAAAEQRTTRRLSAEDCRPNLTSIDECSGD